jgi:NTE family protein
VGLVLSGGGARGFAHVGVLQALEAARVPVDVVVGTSMGAIVGGLYASGMDPQALERELMAIDWAGLFDSRSPRELMSQRRKEEDFELSPVLQLGFRDGEFRLPTGAVSTRSLEWLLRRYTLGTRHLSSFDALPTPFRAVATDMETGQAVVLDRGDLAAALRASMSVPGVFAPLEVDGRILGDGGLVNNLPVDVARQMGADVVIAVNIGTPLARRDSLGSVLGVTAQMINILTEQNVQRSLEGLTPRDLLLAPPLGSLTSSDFERAHDVVRAGQDYAETVVESLRRFAVDEASYARWQLERLPVGESTPGALAFVRFHGVDADRAQHLQRLMDTRAGQPLNERRLLDDLKQLSASGDYDRVDYRLAPDPDTRAEGLVVELDEKTWGPNFFRVGLDLRTDFRGEGAFNLRLSHNRHWLTHQGTEWRSQIQIGHTLGLRSELFQPLGGERDRFFSAGVDTRLQKVELFDSQGNAQALYRRTTTSVSLDHGWMAGRSGQLGDARTGIFLTRRRTTPELVDRSGISVVTDQRWYEHGLRASLVSDQLDHANFPQRGHRVRLEAVQGWRTLDGVTDRFSRASLLGTRATTWGRHTLNLHLELARATDIPAGAVDEYSLGGFHRLSGYKVGQVVGNNLALLRLGYYHRLALNPGLARAVFAGGTVELGNAWKHSSSIRQQGLRAAFSLYLGADTGAGPVYLGLVHAPRGSTGLYFFIGRP